MFFSSTNQPPRLTPLALKVFHPWNGTGCGHFFDCNFLLIFLATSVAAWMTLRNGPAMLGMSRCSSALLPSMVAGRLEGEKAAAKGNRLTNEVSFILLNCRRLNVEKDRGGDLSVIVKVSSHLVVALFIHARFLQDGISWTPQFRDQRVRTMSLVHGH